MSAASRRLATGLLTAAGHLLPPHLSSWSRAMRRELAEIPDDRAALLFAAGCLRAALGLALVAALRSGLAAARGNLPSFALSTWSLQIMKDILARPRLLGLLCAAGAVGLGMAYMLAAGAPSRLLLVNFAALVLGATAWLALGRAASARIAGSGAVVIVLAATLLLTALLGISAEGATRWVSVGGLSLQVSLIVLPPMLILYARHADSIGTAGIVLAALALALQPDRGMAGVLAAGLCVLLVVRPARLPALATASALVAFAWTCFMPDRLPAVPYVDRVLYAAFDVHLLAGAAVVIGAAALLAPALLAARETAGERAPLFAFGGCWLAVVLAAALGNSPTPLVGYGGSAVLGYLLSVALLPHRIRTTDASSRTGTTAAMADGADRPRSELRAAGLG